MSKEITFDESLVSQIKVEDGKLIVPAEAITKHLEGLGTNLEEVTKVQDAVMVTTASLVGACGKVAVDHMAANKDVTNVTGQFEIGRQVTTTNTKRETQVRKDPNDVSKGYRTKYGSTSTHTANKASDNKVKNQRKGISTYAETVLK